MSELITTGVIRTTIDMEFFILFSYDYVFLLCDFRILLSFFLYFLSLMFFHIKREKKPAAWPSHTIILLHFISVKEDKFNICGWCLPKSVNTNSNNMKNFTHFCFAFFFFFFVNYFLLCSYCCILPPKKEETILGGNKTTKLFNYFRFYFNEYFKHIFFLTMQ